VTGKRLLARTALIVGATAAFAGCAPMSMQKEVLATKAAPEAIGPYSQAIKTGPMVFLAGQIPIDPKTNQLMKDASIEEQTALVLDNLKAVLASNGMTMDNIVSTSVFLKDLNDFAKMNTVYATYFTKHFPARSAFGTTGLALGARMELECMATVDPPL